MYVCIYVCVCLGMYVHMCVSVNTLNYVSGYQGEITGKKLHMSNSINDICSEQKF